MFDGLIIQEPTKIQFYVKELKSDWRQNVALSIMVWLPESVAREFPIEVKAMLHDFTLRHYDPKVGVLFSQSQRQLIEHWSRSHGK